MSLDDECAILREERLSRICLLLSVLVIWFEYIVAILLNRIVWRLAYPLFVSPTSTALICKANNRE